MVTDRRFVNVQCFILNMRDVVGLGESEGGGGRESRQPARWQIISPRFISQHIISHNLCMAK